MLNKILFVLVINFSISFSQTVQDSTEAIHNKNISLSELRIQLEDIFNDSNYSNALWGVYVKSLKTGEILYKKNADKLFIPASNLKLFTSATALILLGDNYRYKTKIYTEGEVFKGTLYGDLIVSGSGDPTISNRFTEGDINIVLKNWADSLKQKGIYKITGNLIGDDNAFDERGFGRGWSMDYESSWYASPSGALSYNNNCINIQISPTSNNLPAILEIKPFQESYYFINKVNSFDEIEKPEITLIKNRKNDVITVNGKIKTENGTITEYMAIDDPTDFFVNSFAEELKSSGITLEGYATDLDKEMHNIDYDNTKKIFEHSSVMLSEIIKEINKNSNNFYAEQLIKTIGYEVNNFGTVQNGVKAMREVFEQMGINLDNLKIVDGSGLSRLNWVTPKQIVNLLNYMHKSENFQTFYNSLPIAGRDGTLSNRMKNTSAENNVRAKTGSLIGVSALSGYLNTVDDEPIVFSFIVNNALVPASLAQYLQDMACVRLVNFSRKQ